MYAGRAIWHGRPNEAGSTKPTGRVVYLLRKEQRRGRGPWRGDFRRGDGKEVLGRRDLAGLGAGMELQRREDVLRLGGAGLAEETRRRAVLVAEEGDCSEAEERTKLLQGGRPWHP